MSKQDYHHKITDLLDPNTYRKIPRDPTTSILRKTKQVVKSAPTILQESKRSLVPSEALPPRLYGLPKIHKANIPLRPIVSTIGSPTYDLAKYLTTLLRPHIGKTDSYIKDSTHFVEKLANISCGPSDILVSFDVVSLFTMVPVKDALAKINEVFTSDITDLFKHCLTTTYFQWNGDFYEQLDGVAMGSPLSPVVANFFMECFEEEALRTAAKKPSYWFRYVDDTFVVWPHGEESLNNFFDHLNSLNPRIQFTMERERDHKISFLDVLISRETNGKLGHKVYRKPTHTDRYLHKDSNHHPRQKRGLIKTLVNRATRICQPEHLQEELQYLEKALVSNGYTIKDVRRATHPKRPNRGENESVTNQLPAKGKACIPYIKNVTDRIGKLLAKHHVETIYMPTRKVQQSVKSTKDPRDPLSTAGVYRIPCTCGKVYVGTTKRSIKTRIAEHKRNCRLGQCEKSAVAEHALQKDNHRILYDDTKVLATTSYYYARLHREAIEIHKHPNNFNKKEEGLKLNRIWRSALATNQRAANSIVPHSARLHTIETFISDVTAVSSTEVFETFENLNSRQLRPLPHRL